NYSGVPGLRFECAAVGDSAGIVPFFSVSARAALDLPGLPSEYDQLGSFDPSHIIKHLGGIVKPYIIEHPVESVPLMHLLKKHQITSVDLLHIDAEGYDLRVLAQLDLSRMRPRVILFEHTHLSWADRAKAVRHLHAADYCLFEERCNTLAIAR